MFQYSFREQTEKDVLLKLPGCSRVGKTSEVHGWNSSVMYIVLKPSENTKLRLVITN